MFNFCTASAQATAKSGFKEMRAPATATRRLK
jgi:hypothetical protein